MKKWYKPGGKAYNLYMDMIEKQSHVLIAGATGSGKSVAINAIIHHILFDSPAEKQLVLIDPKRVELCKYKSLPHTIAYASEIKEMIQIINRSVAVMENRYTEMQRHGLTDYNGAAIYIVVDEFADLMTTCKKETLTALCRLAQLGRAANMHLILATQRPTRDIINGQIKVNLDCRLALRCPAKQDSVNIIGKACAESLPKYGYGYYSTSDGLQLVTVPMVAKSEIAERVQHWTKQNGFTTRLLYAHRL